MAQILSLEIIEGTAVHLKHAVDITITYNREHIDERSIRGENLFFLENTLMSGENSRIRNRS